MSEEKFSKCEEGEECLSVEFRVFGKKIEIERKGLRKDFWVEILLSSCSQVRLYVAGEICDCEEGEKKMIACYEKKN